MKQVAMKEFLPQAAKISSAERLVTTLFFAIMVHGMIILGVTFTGEEPAIADGNTLEITLVQTRRSDIPEQADYLSDQSQQGSGNTRERVRPESAMSSPDTMALEGLPDGMDVENRLEERLADDAPETDERDLRQEGAERAITTSGESPLKAAMAAEAPAPTEQRLLVARLMTPGLDVSEPVNETSQRPRAYSDNPREKFIAVNTRESIYARYLDDWRKRVEKVGNANYPATIRDKQGSLVMEVTLNADGTIRDLEVKRRSGFPEMDAAALDILRTASPFAPFSTEMRAEADVLRFVYEWRFGKDAGGSVRASR